MNINLIKYAQCHLLTCQNQYATKTTKAPRLGYAFQALKNKRKANACQKGAVRLYELYIKG